MRDLHLELDPSLGRRQGLEAAIRRAVRSGTLLPGARLPSSRALSEELRVSRATVVAAYDQLVAEGYLASRHGSGTRVASGPFRHVDAQPAVERRAPPAVDLRPGSPDVTLFPRRDWSTAVRAVLRDAPAATFDYGDPRGLPELRHALASYLGRSRAVVADPARIFVFSGFSDALATVAGAIVEVDGRPMAVENPGLPPHRQTLARAGATVRPVEVDDEGLCVDGLARTDAGVVVVTAAHQYPTGVTLSAARRAALVEWARADQRWILEDDYDGEFRYDRTPVGSLQGLAPDRVIYAGTASKSIAPGVGIGWLVVPEGLVDPLVERLRVRVTTSTIEQAAMARFVDGGRLDRHLRRMRGIYRRRRNDLLAVLRAEAPCLPVGGIAAGLHMTVHVADGDQEAELVRQAGEASIALLPLAPHYCGRAGASGLVLGYSRPPQHAFPAAVDRFGAFLRAALAR